MDFSNEHEQYKCNALTGRYLTLKHIQPLLATLEQYFKIEVAGRSVLQQPIYSVTAGNGKCRVLIWSQMHGNESTTTKAIFDFLNFLSSGSDLAEVYLNHFTFKILPMVNPDGADAWTRVNANGIDLNRDSVDLSQPESRVLREAFESFVPHYCYNMHDQRTIFGVGNPPKPATVSFLAPSFNEARDVNNCRGSAMRIIVAMAKYLDKHIRGQVGRFDDSFNINCIGDMFQSLGVPTVLFEAGHYQGDYEREQTRKFIFLALLAGFYAIYENVLVEADLKDYFIIPQNQNVFYDLIYKNVKINYENKELFTNIAAQYEEVIFDDSVTFKAVIREIGKLDNFHAHKVFDAAGAAFSGKCRVAVPEVGASADFFLGSTEFTNGLPV